MIQTYLALQNDGRNEEALRLLARHRCALLCRMHEAQKPLDVLDYYLYEQKKQQNDTN